MAQASVARIGEAAVTAIEHQDWLDGLADRLQRAVHAAVESGGETGRGIRDFLHGTWLGHPLHAVLTDIPLGAWTATVVLDGLDARDGGPGGRYAPGADATIAVGIAGAIGAALAGLADWSHTSGGTRRIGLVHAALNTAALALFCASLGCRRGGQRARGRRLAALGFATGIASACLGGNLVYRQRMGVDHSEAPDDLHGFVDVLAADDLREGQPRRVEVGGLRVVLVRRSGHVAALNEVCPHLGGPLAEGQVTGDALTCPWHGSQFSLDDGSVLRGPATAAAPRYEARIRGGRIEVRPARGDA